MATLLFLGTGASSGCPVIGCSCATCLSQDPKNTRLRASALVRVHGKTLLIDAGPDMRKQALEYNIRSLDGLLITHSHFDHVGGLEELRIYNCMQQKPIPCLLSDASFSAIQKQFYYLFEPKNPSMNFTSQFDFHPQQDERGHLLFCGVQVRYFSYRHAGIKVLGYRFGDLAYITDIKEYPETLFEELQGVSTLVLSALRFGKSALQFSVDEACDFANKVGAKTTYLMHMSHEVEYHHIQTLLPDTIRPAYDGLEIEFEYKESHVPRS